MPSFIEVNKDFVLKLKIQTADQTQIRRVSLPRIADSNGNISYEELVGLVLVFSLPEEDSSNISTRNYNVSLTYYDDEKDLITMASTQELMDAIELFAGQKFVRITTSVKPKKTYSAPPAPAPPASAPPASAPPPPSYTQATNHGTSAKAERSPSGPPIQAVLESFAGILSTAVDNLQEGLAKQSPKTPPSGEDSRLKPTPIYPACKPKEGSPKVARKIKKGMRARRKVDKATTTNTNSAAALGCTPKTNPSSEKAPEKKCTVAEKKNEPEKEPEDPKPFIHGRHTCDSCLTTPIIGKRYHATNIPDYDLCENCIGNYRGSEIKFETVELPQDAVFQGRWRVRYETNARMMAMRTRLARGTRTTPYVPPRSSTTKSSPSQFKAGDNKTSSTNTSSETNRNKGDLNLVRDNASSSNDFDDSLKEAIRRSLDDATKKAKEDEKVKETEEKMNEINQGISECEKRAVDLEEMHNRQTEVIEQMILKKIEDISQNSHTEESVHSKKEAPVEDTVPEKEEIRDIKDDIPRSVDIVEDNTADVERLGISETISEKASVSLELEEEETMQKAMDTDSVDSEKLVSEPSEGEVLPTESDVSKSPSSKQKSTDTSKNESFASDAVGSGDVAEIMGKTLDMVAGAISDMLEESAEMIDGSESGVISEIVEASEDLEKPNEGDTATDNENNEGELIVNSDDDNDTKADEEEDDADWSVVKSIGSNGTTESQKIGRATEMLGSALFNSDMRSSAEGLGSNSVASDSSFSVPSSVPTDLGTVNSRAVAPTQDSSKWANELKKLKELGFDNEEYCIGALERVKADSKTNDINLDLVVSELLFLTS